MFLFDYHLLLCLSMQICLYVFLKNYSFFLPQLKVYPQPWEIYSSILDFLPAQIQGRDKGGYAEVERKVEDRQRSTPLLGSRSWQV